MEHASTIPQAAFDAITELRQIFGRLEWRRTNS